MIKLAGMLLVVFGVVQLAGNVWQGGSAATLVVGMVMVVGGLIVWSLQQIREVLEESREIARDTLAIEAAEPDEVP